MFAYSFIQRLTPNRALALAGLLGIAAALLVAMLPGGLIASGVAASGAAAFVPAAEPPFGATARLILMVFAGAAVALPAWFVLFNLPRLVQLRVIDASAGAPSVRRADAHPDAPPREPLRAGRDLCFEVVADDSDLAAFAVEPVPELPGLPDEPVIAMGDPVPESLPVAPRLADPEPAAPVVQPLPADLDQPLAAFDPNALRETPLPLPAPLAPLHRDVAAPVYAVGERFEAFALPVPAVPAEPAIAPETVATVHSLLDRLERGMARRTAPAMPVSMPAVEGLESALDALRRMAVRA